MGRKAHDEKRDEALELAFDFFSARYGPAITIRDSDTQMTTQEIFTMLSEFCMEQFTGPDVVVLLINSGYAAQVIEKKLFWLLKTLP